ncbi:MAG TPA: CopD family protein [Rhodospirillales bacterium]|jgi:uncharacterized membrane protein
MSAIANALHALAAIVWVGGMFFAYVILRPAVGGIEPPPERPKLWTRVFHRFFLWVGVTIVVLPATGYWRIYMDFGGLAGAALYLHVMHGLGLFMIVLFVYMFGGPYQRFQLAVEAGDLPAAGQHLGKIRQIVGINLILGLVTAAVGASGRLWG